MSGYVEVASTSPVSLPDESRGEFLVIAKLTDINRALIGPIFTTFGSASAEAKRQATLCPGMEVAVFQMRCAHTTIWNGEDA